MKASQERSYKETRGRGAIQRPVTSVARWRK